MRVYKNPKIDFEALTYGRKLVFVSKYVFGDGKSKFVVQLRLILLKNCVLIVFLGFGGVNWKQKLGMKNGTKF